MCPNSRPAAMWVVGLLVAPAPAHQLSVSTGTVVVGRDGITVTLDVSAEDFLHQGPSALGSQPQCSAQWLSNARVGYEPVVLAGLVIRDADGERLGGRVRSSAVTAPNEAFFDWNRLRQIRVTYILEFATSGPQTFLTLRQWHGDAPLRVESQLALDVRREGDREGRTIRLTSRGNVETVEFPAEGPVNPRGIAASDRFKTVHAIIRSDDGGMTVEIHVPLILLETWLSVKRRDPDFLDPAEQAAARDGLTSFFTNVNRVRFDGITAVGELFEIAFLPPQSRDLEGRSDSIRLSAWTARAAVRLRYEAARPPARSELAWSLFNNAILTAQAVVVEGDTVFAREFNTYEPTLIVVHSVR